MTPKRKLTHGHSICPHSHSQSLMIALPRGRLGRLYLRPGSLYLAERSPLGPGRSSIAISSSPWFPRPLHRLNVLLMLPNSVSRWATRRHGWMLPDVWPAHMGLDQESDSPRSPPGRRLYGKLFSGCLRKTKCFCVCFECVCVCVCLCVCVSMMCVCWDG